MPSGTQLNTRIADDLAQQLDALAKATGRPKARLVDDALRSYLETQQWQVQAIQEALEEYSNGTAELVPHEDVMRRIDERLSRSGL